MAERQIGDEPTLDAFGVAQLPDAGGDVPGDPLASHELAAFVRAVELGTIQAAADALSLTQSAVTKRIKALERRVGVSLLVRGRLGVTPTEAGRVLYLPARRALTTLAEAEASLRLELEGEARCLRIAASQTIGEFLLPDWVSAFAQPMGAFRPLVTVVHSPAVVAAIARREADIGFVEFDDPLDGLQSLTLLTDEIVAVVARGHRWSTRETLTSTELVSEPFLAREEGSGTRSVALSRLGEAGVILRPAYEASSTEGLKRAVRSGGFALISRLTVEREIREGSLAALRLGDVDLRRELRALRDDGVPVRGAAGRFWEWLTVEIAGRSR